MDGTAWRRMLRTGAVALVLSALLAIVGQVIYVLSFPGAKVADRLDLVSQLATPALGVLLAGAAILLVAERRAMDPDPEVGTAGRDWVAVAVVALGAVIVLAALYSVFRIVSVHVPSPGSTGQGIRLNISSGDWKARVGQSFLRAAGGVLGAWAAWVVLSMRVAPERVSDPSTV